MKEKIIEPKSPHDQGKKRTIPEREPSQYVGKLAGVDQGYTRHSCEAPKGHPGFHGGRNK